MLKLAGHVPTSSFPFVPGGAAFLAAVVPDISQMIDLNESCKHTLAGHSTHQEILHVMFSLLCPIYCLS